MAPLAKSTPQALQHIHFPSEPCLSRRWSCAARSSAWRPSVGHCRRAAKSRMTMIEGRERQAEARKVVGAVRTRQGYACDLQFHVRTGEGSGRVRVARISSMASTVPRGTSTSASTSRSSPTRPLPRILSFAKERGWRWLQPLSTAGNTYDRDYFGDSTSLAPHVRKQQEFKDCEEWYMPILNVFRHGRGGICHFWGSELLYVPPEPGQEYRHNDLLNPVWNMFDLAPEGGAISNPSSTTRRGPANDAKGSERLSNGQRTPSAYGTTTMPRTPPASTRRPSPTAQQFTAAEGANRLSERQGRRCADVEFTVPAFPASASTAARCSSTTKPSRSRSPPPTRRKPTATGTPSSATAGRRASAAGARTNGAFPGRSRPRVLTEALAAGGDEAKRAFDAMMGMKKIDIAAITAARRG